MRSAQRSIRLGLSCRAAGLAVLLILVAGCSDDAPAGSPLTSADGRASWERQNVPLPSALPTNRSDFVGQWTGYFRDLSLNADGTGSVGIRKPAKLPDGRVVGERWSLRWVHNGHSIIVTFGPRTALDGDGSSGIIEENSSHAASLAADSDSAATTFMLMSGFGRPALSWAWCRVDAPVPACS